MNKLYTSVCKGFIISGMVAFILGFFTQTQVSLDSYIAGYLILSLGMMMILINLFYRILNVTYPQTSFQVMSSIFGTTGPFLLTLCVMAFILYLMIKYKNNIIEGHVSNSYYSFNNIAVMLLFTQIYIIYTATSSDHFEKTGKMSILTSTALYSFGILIAICSINLYTILTYFTTDGFGTITK